MTDAAAPGSSGSASATYGAILLAGGRASRVGGAAKPLFEVGGRTLLGAAIDAVRGVGCAPITVAGPVPSAAGAPVTEPVETSSHAANGTSTTPGTGRDLDLAGIDFVREDPPFGGPVAGTVAVLGSWRSRDALPEWTFLVACDLPRADAAVARLARDLPLIPRDGDGLCLGDEASRPQWLTGVYRTASLLRAADAIADHGRDASVRALVADLAITVVAAPADETADIDTWEDLERAREAAAHRRDDDPHPTEEAS